jgi:class 3 adenylate cyclase/tetratricopeptide (TPR) repeat protein
MSFLETVEKARAFLERNGRISLRAIRREFDLEDGALDELIEELVEIQRVAVRDGGALAWAAGVSPAPTETPEQERTPRDYTPKHLADRILQSKSALEGERKQVTVLFADVKGSVDLSERTDPEEWHRVMDRFFQILADGVHRFEGTINQYTGDGIMALFGAPIAHEDHPQRACYAALHLIEALRLYGDELRLDRGMSFAVRMGLNSGDVVVGKIGDDLRMDYTAQGHTVGLAARMQQIAEPGRVYLTEHTARQVDGFFRLRDLGPSKLRGSSAPLGVYELEGTGPMRTRLDRSRARGFSRFVGRADEMETLETALARARTGQPQVVGVVAEAGSGKSRLCYEFLEQCRARGIACHEAHGVAHGKATPLVPILELYRSYFGITEEDGDRTAREKIAGRLVLLDEGLRESLPLLFETLGVADPEQPSPAMDAEARQRQNHALLKRVVQLLGREQPMVTLLEDLHWFDGASDGYLTQLVDALPATHGLLLLNFRPEYRADWMQGSTFQQLSLVPLGPEAIRELLDDLLGGDPSLAGLAERIHERTAGNPFFSEEVVQSLVDSGELEGSRGAYRLTTPVGRIAVPGTVQTLLAARIDRLPEREKQVLQTASVLGKTFPETALVRVAELPEPDLRAALETLKTGEFLYEAAIYPEREFAFKHPLTEEVAYASQLRERRQRVHAAVARALAELDSEKLDERAALLAHHWEAAGEPLEAARWHGRAAAWVGASDMREAARHHRQTLSLLREVGDAPGAAELATKACRVILISSAAFGLPESEEREVFLEGKRWVERLGSREEQAQLESAYSVSRMVAGDLETALEHGFEAQRLGEDSASPELNLLLTGPVVITLYAMGRLAEARERIEPIVASILDGTPMPGLQGYSVIAVRMLGVIESASGSLATARATLERALELALANPEASACNVLSNFSTLAAINGDMQLGVSRCRRGLELAERTGSSSERLNAQAALARMLTRAGPAQEAVLLAEQAVAAVREAGVSQVSESRALKALAEAQLAAEQLDDARATAEEAISAGQRLGTPIDEADAQLALARVLLRRDGIEATDALRSALDRSEVLYSGTGAKNLQAFIHLERAELARLENDPRSRERELRTALGAFGEMEAPIRVREVEALLADSR